LFLVVKLYARLEYRNEVVKGRDNLRAFFAKEQGRTAEEDACLVVTMVLRGKLQRYFNLVQSMLAKGNRRVDKQ